MIDDGIAMTAFRKLRIVAFWATTLFSYGSAIVPGEEAPTLGSTDKVNHIAAFLTLSLLIRLAYPLCAWWRAALSLIAFGAFIEISQAVPFIHRDADVMDWLADSAAVAVGLGATYLLMRWKPTLFAA
jgi:VanZ family protein